MFPFIIMSSIFVLWPPRILLPSTLPSIMSRIMLSCLSMWPIHFRCLSLIVFRRLRVSPAITSTSSFDNLSIHLILNMRRHIHISNASSLLQSSFLRVHVSQPYKVTLHTRLFTRRFLREILVLVLSSSRRLRNACLPMAILALTSFALRPSLSSWPLRNLRGFCGMHTATFPKAPRIWY